MAIRLYRIFLVLFVFSAAGFEAGFESGGRAIAATKPSGRAVAQTPRQPAVGQLDRQPLSFEENRGQTDPRVRFLCRGGSTVFLSVSEAVLRSGDDSLRLGFTGANTSPRLSGVDPVERKSAYLTGNDPAKWNTEIPHFAGVRYEQLYPGIDAVFYGNGGRLEYDFVLQAGVDPGAIRIGVSASDVRLEPGGELVFRVGAERVVQQAPRAYQVADGVKRNVAARYVLHDRTVSFAVAAHDRALPLVIDPVLAYSTYLGGSAGDDGADVATDPTGAVYVTGFTQSADFPVVGSRTGVLKGGVDVYVARFNADGRGGSYSTYIGGSGIERGLGIGVDTRGSAYVTGFTNSTDFPVVSAFQRTPGGGFDAFLCKLTPEGDAFEYSTYLGGSDDENFTPNASMSSDLATEPAGGVVVIGYTKSRNFPLSQRPLQSRYGGGNFDAFLVRFGPQGNFPIFSTYFGGSDDDLGKSVALDGDGAVYFTAQTRSPNLPVTQGVVQPQYSGAANSDACVVKMNGVGTQIAYCTYLGGRGTENAGTTPTGIAVDPPGSVYITGSTSAADFPVTGGLLTQLRGRSDAFLTKLDPDARQILFSTFLGGREADQATGVTFDFGRNVYVVGWTESPDFPLRTPVQSALQGSMDAFVIKISADGRRVIYSTYVGGAGGDIGQGIAALRAGKVYITGVTNSTDFLAQNAFQPAAGGQGDAFLTKIIDVYSLDWDAPDQASPENLPPPRFLRSRRVTDDSEQAAATIANPARAGAARRDEELLGYNVYTSPTPNATPESSTLLTSVPPTQTTTGAAAPGGSFFTVTAVYPSGESSVSNEASGGAGEATITAIKVTNSKIRADGEGFTETVQVYIDGIPFVSASKVKNESTRVVQKGTLLTGETIGDYLDAHGGTVVISFRNSDGAVAAYRYEDE